MKKRIQNSIHYLETTINNKVFPYIKELINYSDNFDFGRLNGQSLLDKFSCYVDSINIDHLTQSQVFSIPVA